jgi:squalene-associated FAD-dependent desaturase
MTVHVVGAGLAGLSAALTLSRRGEGPDVVLHEASGLAGGRCRSWRDERLGATIDNGTHVVVGANRAVGAHLAALGVADRLHWFEDGIDFLDLSDSSRWRIATPLDLLRLARRRGASPGREALTALRLAAPVGPHQIGRRLRGAALTEALWDPLARAVMNTDPAQAAAGPFARVLRRTLAAGTRAMRVAVARTSLEECFVTPCLAALREAGARLRFDARLTGIERSGDRVAALRFAEARLPVGAADRVVLALPPWDLARLLPDHAVPFEASPIVNFHVRLERPSSDRPLLRGLIGGTAEWVLARGDIASATVSAADALAERDGHDIAALLWRDVARALAIDTPLPPAWRVIKERRATPRQDFAFETRRPGATTGLGNLVLAGDWVEPGLPCTIETALASGARAAEIVGRRA